MPGIERPQYNNERDRRLRDNEEELLVAEARREDTKTAVKERVEFLLRLEFGWTEFSSLSAEKKVFAARRKALRPVAAQYVEHEREQGRPSELSYISMSDALESHQPFQPVFKADAAALLRVCERTIDNYIQSELLPKPARFGHREMCFPDVFYGHLSAALLNTGPGGRAASKVRPGNNDASREPLAVPTSPGRDAPTKQGRAARLQALNQGSFTA
ncbi:MAG: hypothetical protein C0423_09740 [Methylibium sp.]|nr:hypothetical protein [Methylibium sp.]